MFHIATALTADAALANTGLVFDDYLDAINAATTFSFDADLDRYPLDRISVVRTDDNTTLVTFHQSDLRRNL